MLEDHMDGREPAPAWFQLPPEVEANANRMRAFCPKHPAHRPTGADTSMLAQRLTTMLPAMTLAEAIDTTPIHNLPRLPLL
jgi:Magnesium chelatase, subunit ChlI